MAIDIVFDGPPGSESCRFVEVEDNGRSIKFGDWIDRGNGLWALRLPIIDESNSTLHLTASGHRMIENREATDRVIERVLQAHDEQGDPIPESDLDNEQPIPLTLHVLLGDLRALRSLRARAPKRPTVPYTDPLPPEESNNRLMPPTRRELSDRQWIEMLQDKVQRIKDRRRRELEAEIVPLVKQIADIARRQPMVRLHGD